METNSKFGIEVEYFITGRDDHPVLNSNELAKTKCLDIDPSLNIVQELSSFQIEINPGPWQLNLEGFDECIADLMHHYSILKKVIESYGWKLCHGLTPKRIKQETINDPDFFTKSPRFKASSDYFSKGENILLRNPLTKLEFPGETIIGCINEIHIHAQLANDCQTLDLFNYLNSIGLRLVHTFNKPIQINNQIFKDFDSIKLFELVCGEFNNDETIPRTGLFPYKISCYEDYVAILKTFNKIPFGTECYLDLESTVYFWTRLRGKKGNLRVEFRPMEMGENWIQRVRFLYKIIKNFERTRVNKLV